MIQSIVTTAIIVLGIVISVFIASQSYDQQSKNQAIADCAKAGTVETIIEQGAQKQTFTQPDGAWYETCMKDKGYREKN